MLLRAGEVLLVVALAVRHEWTVPLVTAIGVVAAIAFKLVVSPLVQSELRRAGRYDEMDRPPEMPERRGAFGRPA